MPRKCEVTDRCSLVVGKGSIVFVDDRQFELARRFLKPVEVKPVKEEKPAETVEEDVVEEKPKRRSKK